MEAQVKSEGETRTLLAVRDVQVGVPSALSVPLLSPPCAFRLTGPKHRALPCRL